MEANHTCNTHTHVRTHTHTHTHTHGHTHGHTHIIYMILRISTDTFISHNNI